MKPVLNGFNWIAGHYDKLANLVFGDHLDQSQRFYLEELPADARVLMIGGGSGKTLRTLLELRPRCTVSFVEASSTMIRIARQQIAKEDHVRVNFIHGAEIAFGEDRDFDVVITNFFLDVFTDHHLEALCRDISRSLDSGGLWLAADFVRGRHWWQRVLMWTMYRFFVVTCRIQARRLPDWEKHLTGAGLKQLRFRLFADGFIKSIVFINRNESTHQNRHIKQKILRRV